MYNYPGQYGRPPSYAGFPGAGAPPPGMAGAPGMGPPPGVGAPPGVQQAQSSLPGRPGGGLPPNFQPPPNMPNINFSAPVIRLGTSGPNKSMEQDGRKSSNQEQLGGRRGLGMGRDYNSTEQQRQQVRENMMALAPPTREEIMRTIFIGNITEGIGSDENLERILRTAGNLRRWSRATDADNKTCTFGFAEYEDAESLETAAEILRDIRVPVRKQQMNGVKKEEDEDEKPEMIKLLVVVDENSIKYAEEWRTRRNEDESTHQFRCDTAREALNSVLEGLKKPQADVSYDHDGDIKMGDGEVKQETNPAEVVTIPLTQEEELADIPEEMRETVAAEIAAFRDRSNRRDMERLKQEEEREALERQRSMAGRVNRLASPPISVPTGPAGGANGIPLGPRAERGIQGAPSGPKGYQGQMPRDYQGGISFVNGSNNGPWYGLSEEDDSASDEELERRRREKKEAELEKIYLDNERRWLNRERRNTAATERDRAQAKDDEINEQRAFAASAKKHNEWNDELEASRNMEEYYRDRSLWLRKRAQFRTVEDKSDELDRIAEQREKVREDHQKEQARGKADSFLAQMGPRMEAPKQEPQRFKMSFGAAVQKTQTAPPKRSAAEVEGLLENEEEEETSVKRTLKPLKVETREEGAALSDEDRQAAARQLAGDIPTSKEGLWNWPIKWEFVEDAVITEQLRPFVEKKVMEYLGVQEQMLVDVAESYIRKKGNPEELVRELEGALEEEAEGLVKKLWRMIIFFSESEKRGLHA